MNEDVFNTSLRKFLKQVGVTHIVVHTDLYPPGEWARVERRIEAFQGALELRYADAVGRVYALRRARER